MHGTFRIAANLAVWCSFVAISGEALQPPAAWGGEPPTNKPPIPKKSIRFGDSLEEALLRAKREGRRVLVYFTGDGCGWCRKMEAETHSDPGVIELASKCVCVKVNIGKRPDLEERYAIYGVPVTLAMTADGKPIDEFPGYGPPAEHLPWLKEALEKQPTTWPKLYERLARAGTHTMQPTAPPPPGPRGVALEQTDLVIWFIEENSRNFENREWASHDTLLRYLASKGFRPRVEHYYQWRLTDAWRNAEATHRLPDVLAGPTIRGLFLHLVKRGRLEDALSWRLKLTDRWVVCSDFESRWIWTVTGSPHAERAAKAVWDLFAPRETPKEAHNAIRDGSERKAVSELASRTAKCWYAGDVDSLRPLWDEQATQRHASLESNELRDRKHSRVRAEGSTLYGNDRLIMAIVETRAEETWENPPAWYCAKTRRIGTPTLVILRHGNTGWRVLAVGMLQYDLNVLPSAADLIECASGINAARAAALEAAQLISPANRADFGNEEFTIRWRLPAKGSERAHFWLATTHDDQGWPSLTLAPLSANQRDGEMKQFIRGPTTAEIWTIGADG